MEPCVFDLLPDDTNECLVVDVVKASLNVTFDEPSCTMKLVLKSLSAV